MAIIKKLSSKVGIDVSYHRVIAINTNYRDKKVVICLASYVDKDTRSYRFDPLEVVDIEVPEADYKLFLGVNQQEAAYNWLKKNVEGFDKSVDDLDCREVVVDEKDTKE